MTSKGLITNWESEYFAQKLGLKGMTDLPKVTQLKVAVFANAVYV